MVAMTAKPRPSPQNAIDAPGGPVLPGPPHPAHSGQVGQRPAATMTASAHGSSTHSLKALATVSSGGP